MNSNWETVFSLVQFILKPFRVGAAAKQMKEAQIAIAVLVFPNIIGLLRDGGDECVIEHTGVLIAKLLPLPHNPLALCLAATDA